MFRFILKPGRTNAYVRGIDKNIGPEGYETDSQKAVAACAIAEGLVLVGSDEERKMHQEIKRREEWVKAQSKPEEPEEVPEPVAPPRPPPVPDARSERQYLKPIKTKRK